MNALAAELIKLRRCLAWAVVVLLPILVVLVGAATRLSTGARLRDGWHTMWQQSVGFYGLFPLAIGVAILGSLVWRVEHRGGNWNALMSGPTSSLRIVVAKGAMVAWLAALMQAVLVLTVVAVGKLAFGLPGMLPARYLAIAAVLAVACVPAAVAQSALSLFLRSFAAPIAVALAGAAVSTGALMAAGSVGLISPYGLATRAALLGTGFLVDGGDVAGSDIASIAAASVLLTVVLVAATAWLLDRRDTRA